MRRIRLSEIEPDGATLTAPRTGLRDRRLERPGGVVGVHELQPRVEAELGRDHRQRQVADQRGVEAGADLGLVAQHAAGDLGVAAGEVVEVALELGDVALEPGAQRHPPARSSVKKQRRRPSQP